MKRPSCHPQTVIAGGALLVAAYAMLAGCGGSDSAASPAMRAQSSVPPAVSQASNSGAAVPGEIVAADNAFGLKLLAGLVQKRTGNTAISPTSLALALQIVYNGSEGTTQQAMAQVLQLGGLGTEQLNDDNAALQASLLHPDPQTTLTLANSLWMHLDDNPVLPSFISINQTYYGAMLGDLAGAPENVNGWVATQTNGLITSILPSGDYRQAAAVIANAIYFKGQWTTPFEASQTASGSFTLTDGSQKPVAMMHCTGSYPYLEGPGFQAIRLPYGQGRLSMLILLPDSGTSLQAFIAGLTADSVRQWTGQMQNQFLSLSMPRFATAFAADLSGDLSALGMSIAFSCLPPDRADFSGLAAGVCLTSVEHRAVVEVDETGTTATAATGVIVGITAAPGLRMTLDRPFFYAVRDDESGLLLFIGALLDPTEE
jgi:serine protease inhibitor